MRPLAVSGRWFFLLACLGASAFCCGVAAQTRTIGPSRPDKSAYRPGDPLNAAAFDHFYNLDYDHSIAEFAQILQRHPDDPFAINHLLVAALFRELDRIGALNSGDYTNDLFVSTPRLPADPAAKSKSKTWLTALSAWKKSGWRPTRRMSTRFMPAASPGRNRLPIPRWSSARGFQRCAMPWARGATTNEFWSWIRITPRRS